MSPLTDAVLARLEAAVGRNLLMTDPEYCEEFAVNGCVPSVVVHPNTVEEVQQTVQFCVAEGLALIPTGWRQQTLLGGLPARYDVALNMQEMIKVTSYDPGDLTLSCEAGITLKDLEEQLRAHGQFLPLESECGHLCTVGGALATNASGPLRYSYGTARDFVLGMSFVTGEGKLCKSGGRVVKNVAGYDLHKLMIGSLGTLGVITSANFRTFPIPPATATFVCSFRDCGSAIQMLSAIRKSPLQPRAVEIVSPEAAEYAYDPDPDYREDPLPYPRELWSVAVGVGGKEQVVDRHRRELDALGARLGAAFFEEARDRHEWCVWSHLESLTEAPTILKRATTVIKISALLEALPTLLSECGEIGRRHGLPCMSFVRAASTVYVSLRPDDVEEQTLSQVHRICTELMETAARLKGQAIIHSTRPELKKRVNVWGPPRGDAELMRRLKKVFDPHGILSPGRFYGDI